MRTLPDGTLVPDPGEIPMWDGARWIYAPPPLIPGPRGPGGGCGGRGPAGPAGPAGPGNLVSVGEFQRLPGIETTSSVVPVPYWSIPFTLSAPADVLFQMAAIVFEAPPIADPTNFMGFTFTCDIDGNPLPDSSAFELNLNGASVNTSVETALLQTYAPALAAGAHVLNVFWSANDADNVILSGEANIAIQSL